jgi:hypothetical protein
MASNAIIGEPTEAEAELLTLLRADKPLFLRIERRDDGEWCITMAGGWKERQKNPGNTGMGRTFHEAFDMTKKRSA